MSMLTSKPTFARRGRDGLAQIGQTRFDVVGIRFMADGDGADGADAAAQAAAAQQNNDPKPPWGDDPSKFDPDKAWKLIQNVKSDLAEQKTKTEQAIADAAAKAQKDTLAQFAALLTGEKEPETDPAKLAATIAEKDTALTAAQAATIDAQRVAQAAILAGPLGANVGALLADPAFKTSLASVDPTKEADVKSAITQALQANAALKQPPRQSGAGEHTGPTVQTLESLLAEAEKAGDAAESITLKRRIAELRTKS